MRLFKKRILLGVTGSIAAYKSAEIIRLLVKEGAEVQVIMTKSAHDFITPLTLGTLSRLPILTDFSDPNSGTWNNHVELGLWADLMIIAPITANTLSKLTVGQCDDLLTAVYLSARCPVFLAPAMDLDMFAHPSTSENISKLLAFGTQIIGPASGELASGLKGEGRMVEPADICSHVIQVLSPHPYLKGKKVLVSTGPTRESIDPVRFISNHSSGKMGVAIAESLAMKGALVTLVAGPGVIPPRNPTISIVKVTTAHEMYEACIREYADSPITIMAAAVADFTPVKTADSKIKKEPGNMTVELKATKDILADMGEHKGDKFLVGFALETDNEISNAIGKLERKNLDLIVLNSMQDSGAGFNGDTNKITIIEKNKNTTSYELKSKKEVASDITDKIISCLSK